jgi:hypothetical protein
MLADLHRLDAARHRTNAARHLAEGRPAYAAGSLRKAEKFERRAAQLEAWLRPESTGEQIILDAYMREVERILLG